MTAIGEVVEDATVVMSGGRIRYIGKDTGAPKSAAQIDGGGKFLLPAFADMHVHIEHQKRVSQSGAPESFIRSLDAADLLLPYVAAGVLQVFNLSADAESFDQEAAVESGRILGPHLAQAYLIEGGPVHPVAATASDPEAGRKLVKAAAARGYDAIKVYSRLNFETYEAILNEAKAEGLRVIGHLPLRGMGRTRELLAAGIGMVAHAEEFAYQAKTIDQADIPAYAQAQLDNKVALVTTIKTNERIVERTASPHLLSQQHELEYVHPVTRYRWLYRNDYAQSPERLARRLEVVPFNAALVREFSRRGVPMLAGTDAGVAGVVPGFGLHDELAALVRAGLPAELVLHQATRLPAAWLGTLHDRGTVEIGKRADLILLEGDPRREIAYTRRINTVFVSGRPYPRAELDKRMEALAARYAAMWTEAKLAPNP